MRLFLTLIFAFSVILCGSTAFSEENSEEISMDEAVSVGQNQRAPFDGILMPTEMAIQLGFRIETLQQRLTLDVQREQRLCSAQINFETRRRELEEERRDYQISLLEERVVQQAEELAEPIPWYRRWGFAFGMGVLTSTLLVAGGIALILGVI